MVQKPMRELKHFGNDYYASTIKVNLYSQDDTLILTEGFKNESNIWFPKGKYVVNTYKVDASVAHAVSSGYSIVGAWPVHSMSNVFPLFNGNNELQPRYKVYFNSLDQDSAYLTGYVYLARDTLGTVLGWWPRNNSMFGVRLSYSLLLHDNQYPPLSVQKKERNASVGLFPNPSANLQTLRIATRETEEVVVSLFDLKGRLVRTVYKGKSSAGILEVESDISSLARGVYIYKIMIGKEIYQLKSVKL